MAIEIVPADALPQKARGAAWRSDVPLPVFPIDRLESGQGLRIPFADLGGVDLRKAHGTLRVRAHRTGKRLGRAFKVHLAPEAFYVSRVA